MMPVMPVVVVVFDLYDVAGHEPRGGGAIDAACETPGAAVSRVTTAAANTILSILSSLPHEFPLDFIL